MSSVNIIFALSISLLLAVIVGAVLWLGKRRASRRMTMLNQ